MNSKQRIAAVPRTMRERGRWGLTFLADTASTAILKRGIPLLRQRQVIEVA